MTDETNITNENQEAAAATEESGTPAENKLSVVKKIIDDIQLKLKNIQELLGGWTGGTGLAGKVKIEQTAEAGAFMPGVVRVVEGVFDGQNMIGSDGMQYTVPANYASKSKLVEGDIMKLTIAPNGSFIFKQIGPVERTRVVGTLAVDPETGDFVVFGDNRKWKVLKASITYYRGAVGDEVILLIPKNAPSHFAAVENIIKK
jgi:hypothetical protein